MSRLRISVVALCVAFLLSISAAARADQQADDLYKQYKSYKSKGQYDLAAKAVCDSAKIDSKYQNECDQVSTYVNGRLQDFETTFVLAQAEFNRGNCADALRDFGKISFGPHRDEAVTLGAKAKDCVENPPPKVDPREVETLKGAQVAFENGNFPTAEVNARQIKSPDLLPQAQKILNDIKNYYDAVQRGDDLLGKTKYAEAQQQYNVALGISRNGPGNLSAKLKKIDDIAHPKPPGGTQDTNLARIQPILTQARSEVASGDCNAALASYARVLQIDPAQQEALSGQKTCQDIIAGNGNFETMLVNGVRDFYDSNFNEARTTISLYLTLSGVRSKGAAYFYLGATILSQAVLSSPKEKKEYDRLNQAALENFQKAKQEKFKPVEKYVSPRILAVWAQAGM